MEHYELVCAFIPKEGQEVTGRDAVREILVKSGADIQSEKDMGNRELAYQIQKEDRAHYHVYVFSSENTVIPELKEALSLKKEILRFLVVKQ